MALPDNLLKEEVRRNKGFSKSMWFVIVILMILVVVFGIQLFLSDNTTLTGGAVLDTRVQKAPEQVVRYNEPIQYAQPKQLPLTGVGLTDDEGYQFLRAVLELEHVTAREKIRFAGLISDIDYYVEKAGNLVLSAYWSRFIECYGKSCEAEFSFPDFEIDILEELYGVSTEKKGFSAFKKNPKNQLHLVIREALILRKASNKNDLVAISNSVSYIQNNVAKLNNVKITDRWNVLLECNYVCEEYDEFMTALVDYHLDG